MVQGVYLSPIHLSIYTPAHASQGEHNAHKDDIRDAAEADGETRRQEIKVDNHDIGVHHFHNIWIQY